MKNKSFIFDWSGTLSDNFHIFCKICDIIFFELGRELISKDEIRMSPTSPYMKFWNKYLPNLTREEQCILFEKYSHQVGRPKLYKNAREIINFLNRKGYKLFILSSDPISVLIPEIERSGFSNLITKIAGDIYNKEDVISSFIREFNLDKNLTFYVGDTSGDVEAGKIAKVKTIGISWGFQNKEILSKSNPDFLIDNLNEIKDIINLN